MLPNRRSSANRTCLRRGADRGEKGSAEDESATDQHPRRRSLADKQERKNDTVYRLERSNDTRRVRGKDAQAADEQRVRERGAGDAEHEQQPDLTRIGYRRCRRCERKRQNRRRGVLPERDRSR